MNGIVKYICAVSSFSVNVKFVRFMPIVCSGSLYIFADEIVFSFTKEDLPELLDLKPAGLNLGEPELGNRVHA